VTHTERSDAKYARGPVPGHTSAFRNARGTGAFPRKDTLGHRCEACGEQGNYHRTGQGPVVPCAGERVGGEHQAPHGARPPRSTTLPSVRRVSDAQGTTPAHVPGAPQHGQSQGRRVPGDVRVVRARPTAAPRPERGALGASEQRSARRPRAVDQTYATNGPGARVRGRVRPPIPVQDETAIRSHVLGVGAQVVVLHSHRSPTNNRPPHDDGGIRNDDIRSDNSTPRPDDSPPRSDDSPPRPDDSPPRPDDSPPRPDDEHQSGYVVLLHDQYSRLVIDTQMERGSTQNKKNILHIKRQEKCINAHGRQKHEPLRSRVTAL
jgi:hypothetical protein